MSISCGLLEIHNGKFQIMPYTCVNVDWGQVSSEFNIHFISMYQEAKTLVEAGQVKGLYQFSVLERIGNLINEKKVSMTDSFSVIYNSLSETSGNELQIA